jgi:hypothetical protein
VELRVLHQPLEQVVQRELQGSLAQLELQVFQILLELQELLGHREEVVQLVPQVLTALLEQVELLVLLE